MPIIIIIAIILILLGYFLRRMKVNQYSVLDSKTQAVIDELMKRSNLPQNICTDIYMILIQFSKNNRDNAYSLIAEELIPDLKSNNHPGDVGIAFRYAY